MAIRIGEVTVVADKAIDIYTVTISKQSGEWTLYIEYAVIIGEQRTDKKVILTDGAYNEFDASWNSWKQIMDLVMAQEQAEPVVENVANAEFVNLPEPAPEPEPTPSDSGDAPTDGTPE